MGGRGVKHELPTRRRVLNLVDEAVAQGARLFKCCQAIGLHLRTLQRWRARDQANDLDDRRAQAVRQPANKLSESERQKLLEVANSPEYCDLSPHVLVPTLADQGIYLASESTFYRTLREAKQLTHRGRARKPRPQPKEHVTTAPNQVWSWDITYLPLQVKGQHVYLYMFMDIWSRKIVGWEVHEHENMSHSSTLIERLFVESKQSLKGLVLHADNGGPMRGYMMKEKLEELGVMASYSRARVSDDNPFSEALFRTVKYKTNYPERFKGLEQARTWVSEFVEWYNHEHLHSGIGFVTPQARHTGSDVAQLEARDQVYAQAYQDYPERFTGPKRQHNRPDTVTLHKRTSSHVR